MRARELGVSFRVYPRTTLHYRRRKGSLTFGKGEEALTLARMLKRSIDRRGGTKMRNPSPLLPLSPRPPLGHAARDRTRGRWLRRRYDDDGHEKTQRRSAGRAEGVETEA